jgi:hypothetical protein
MTGEVHTFAQTHRIKHLKGDVVYTKALFVRDRVSYVAQAGFKLAVILPQSPKCWDYNTMPGLKGYF